MMHVAFQGQYSSAIEAGATATITASATPTYSNEFRAFVNGLNEGSNNGYNIVLTSFYCTNLGNKSLHIESIRYNSNDLTWEVTVRNDSSTRISESEALVGVQALVLKGFISDITVPYISCDGGGGDDEPPREGEGGGVR